MNIPFNELCRMADGGNINAIYEIGEAYWSGKNGVMQDKQKAVRCYEIAANKGHLDSIYSLGFAYINGTGVNQDYYKGEMLLLYAADRGHELAASQLGLYYTSNRANGYQYSPTSSFRGYEYYKYAASLGNLYAKTRIAEMYFDTNWNGIGPGHSWEKGRQLMDELIEQGSTDAMLKAAYFYREGFNGYPCDIEKAFNLYWMAAKKDHPVAQHDLACMLLTGEYGRQNIQEGIRWLQASEYNGYELAGIRMAMLKISGEIPGLRCRNQQEYDYCMRIINKARSDSTYSWLFDTADY